MLENGIFNKSSLVNGTQASLSDRFLLELHGIDFALVESIGRPGYKIETESFQLMDYNINFPKRPVFDSTVQIVLVELLDPDINLTQMENVMSRIINQQYYTTPSGIQDPRNPFGTDATAVFNVSKKALTSATTAQANTLMVLHTLDPEGQKYESIRFINPMITGVAFSGLKSGGAEINKITLTVTFDYVDYGRKGSYNYGGLYNQFRSMFPDLDNTFRNSLK